MSRLSDLQLLSSAETIFDAPTEWPYSCHQIWVLCLPISLGLVALFPIADLYCRILLKLAFINVFFLLLKRCLLLFLSAFFLLSVSRNLALVVRGG